MKPPFTIFFRKHWDALLAALTVCIFIYLFTRKGGIGISPDSVSYLSAATNIREHFSFTDFNGLPLVDFPRGYPLFLALMARLSGSGVFQIAPVVNAILFSSVILLASVIIAGHRNISFLYKILFLSVLALSPALLEVYSMLWSETLFIVWCLLFFVTSRNYLSSHSSVSLVIMAVIAALAFVTRYAGLCIVATGAALIFFDGSLSIIKKIFHLLLFGSISSSLAIVNLFFNHKAAASLTGVREKALRSVGDNIGQISDVVATWLPFLKTHSTVTVIVLLIVFALALFSFAFRILQQQYYTSYETVISCFTVVYLLFIITIASLSRFEDLSNRLLSPVYIPLLLVGTVWIPGLLQKLASPGRYLLLGASLVLFVAFQVHQYKLNAEAWEGIRDAGIPGYTEHSWKKSPTVIYLQQHKDSLTSSSPVLYSDANDAAYFMAGLHARPLPHKEISTEIIALLKEHDFSVIWFDDGYNADLIDIDFIKQHKKLVSGKIFEGGAIYHFSDSQP